MVAERRCLAFTALDLWAFDAFDRVVGDGVSFAEIFEQRRQRREAMADGGTAAVTLGETVGARRSHAPW
jgi:hypothetical protein